MYRFTPRISRERLREWVKSLNLSAEDKGALWSLADITIQIGKKLVRIGLKVLEMLYKIVRKFPNTSTGALIGLGLWMIINMIPLVGHLIGGVFGPLAVLIASGMGLMSDLGLHVQRAIASELR